MRLERLRERLRRQETANRRLAEQQRAIVTAGGARLSSLEAAVEAIEANSSRIDLLEELVGRLEEHAADEARHTGRP